MIFEAFKNGHTFRVRDMYGAPSGVKNTFIKWSMNLY